MTATNAICIILCTFIVCVFIFFTIVYLSELRRESKIRNLLLEEQKRNQQLMTENGLVPVVVMDLPLKQKSKEDPTQPVISDKNKKNFN